MAKNEIIAYHGWGFDSGCWSSWEDLMPEGIRWMNFDKGYFRDPQSPHFSKKSEKKILLTHSFGLHQCSEEMLAAADLLVIISGFLSFHPEAAKFRQRSKQVLTEMINQFKEQPQNVLRVFYHNVYYPEKSYALPQAEMDQPLLLDDLKWLNHASMPLPKLKKSAEVCIFQGEEDVIVPNQKGRALYEKFEGRAQYFEIKTAGHALPMTHANKCWNIVKNEMFNLTR